jgi:hypothetical protein
MLTIATIVATKDDGDLIDILSSEVRRLLPVEVLDEDHLYFASLAKLPRGLRAMQSIHSFDVSMAMDDLAWHFLNHSDDISSQAIYDGLVELELDSVARLFRRGWQIWEPHLVEYRRTGCKARNLISTCKIEGFNNRSIHSTKSFGL